MKTDPPSGAPDAHATQEERVACVPAEVEPGSITVMHIHHTRFPAAELPPIIEGLPKRGDGRVTLGRRVSEQRAEGAAPGESR